MLITILATAAFASPVQIAGSIRSSDYPREALKDDKSGMVMVALQINPSGNVERCDIYLSTSPELLEQATCEIFQKRFRYKPALNNSGQPIYAVIKQHVNWLTGRGGTFKFYRYAELALSLNKLPKGLENGHIENLALLVSAVGNVEGCSSSFAAKQPVLSRLACKEAIAGFKPTPVRNTSGQAVESVRIVGVSFKKSLEKATPDRSR